MLKNSLLESLTYKPVELSFGTSGLRGLVTDMTDLECYINIEGFLIFLKNHDGLQNGDKIYIAGDLRDSTPNILKVVTQACFNNGVVPIYCGLIPTPAIAIYALSLNAPCIMVTGSHIPADRNGIKFYKRAGEVLKTDEEKIQESVASVRTNLYESETKSSLFQSDGSLVTKADLPTLNTDAETQYIDRFLRFFSQDSFKDKTIIVYQQSAVGRDIIVKILNGLGAHAIPIERSDVFIPIDTENVNKNEKDLFKKFAIDYPDAFAIVSTDGDSDRPFVIDETGIFLRGDVLGCLVADYVGAGFAATPISSNDAVDIFAKDKNIQMVHTKIGSPYVIDAMLNAKTESRPIVSWEVNGGFLLGTELTMNGQTLTPLPTRDAIFPILCTLLSAVDKNIKVSELFATLPHRYTGGGLIDNVPMGKIKAFKNMCSDAEKTKSIVESIFMTSDLGAVKSINLIDGLRIIFESNQIIHLRPSGNAPQFRVYTNSDSQDNADRLSENATKPGGYIELLLSGIA